MKVVVQIAGTTKGIILERKIAKYVVRGTPQELERVLLITKRRRKKPWWRARAEERQGSTERDGPGGGRHSEESRVAEQRGLEEAGEGGGPVPKPAEGQRTEPGQEM